MFQRFQKTALRAIAALVCATVSVSGHAAGQWCTGTISHSWVDAGGNFYVLPSWRGDHVRLCSVKTTLPDVHIGGIDPVICKSWVALVLQAVAASKSMVIQYPEAPACNAIPHYHLAPLPNYVMVVS
jgi:hypothetical protein